MSLTRCTVENLNEAVAKADSTEARIAECDLSWTKRGEEGSVEEILRDLRMASLPELNNKFAALEERVANHIRFFWAGVAGAAVWLAYLSTTLFNMNGSLKSIEGQMAKTTVASHAQLDKEQFKESLPELGTALSVVRTRNIDLPKKQVLAIRDNLVAISDRSPGFWQTATELIRYEAKPIGVAEDCARTNPEHLKWLPIDHPEYKGEPPPDQIRFRGCRLNLDAPLPSSAIRATQTDAVSIVCEDCTVHYSGGGSSILLTRKWVGLIFKDCAFDFSASDSSPDQGKNLITTVLSAPSIGDVSYFQEALFG